MTSLRLIVAFCVLVATVSATVQEPATGELFESKQVSFDLPINSLIYTVDAAKLATFLQDELRNYIQLKSGQASARVIREAERNGVAAPRLKRYLVESKISLIPVDNTSGEPVNAPIVRLPRSEGEEAASVEPEEVSPPSAKRFR